MDGLDLYLLIGKRLRVRRRLLGMTQEALAAKVGMQFQQICKFEQAQNRVSIEQIVRFARALGTDVNYFLDGLT